MAKILAVGIATVDILNKVLAYPQEDEEIRVISQQLSRGGNATNTLAVLSQFDHDCYWAGNIVTDHDSRIIFDDLRQFNINTTLTTVLPRGKVPTSYITLCQKTGSRTIQHYRDLAEYSFECFASLSLEQFQWIHFEGRAINEISAMMRHTQKNYPNIKISLEIEKPRTSIESLFSIPNLLVFSQNYIVQKYSAGTPLEFLDVIHQKTTADVVCAWGATGAYAKQSHGNTIYCAAPRITPIDTNGAGDTLNAALIHGYINQWNLEKNLQNAVDLATKKCAQQGFSGLAL